MPVPDMKIAPPSNCRAAPRAHPSLNRAYAKALESPPDMRIPRHASAEPFMKADRIGRRADRADLPLDREDDVGVELTSTPGSIVSVCPAGTRTARVIRYGPCAFVHVVVVIVPEPF